MAINVNHILLCEWFVQDIDDRFSFINIFGNVTPPAIPATLASLIVAVELTGDPDELFTVEIRDPKKHRLTNIPERTIGSPQKPVGNPLTQIATNAVLQIRNVTFDVEGVHHVVVRSGKNIIGRRPFGVFARQPDNVNA